MDESTILRCLSTAHYMLENRATVRQAAAKFGISKSSVHKDMCQRLPKIDARLAKQVAALLEYNKAVRHLRAARPRAGAIRACNPPPMRYNRSIQCTLGGLPHEDDHYPRRHEGP